MSVLIWMSKLQLPERESTESFPLSHLLNCFRGGGLKQNDSGDYCQAEDHDAEKGRIKALINNERDGTPLHLIIGAPCRLHSTS